MSLLFSLIGLICLTNLFLVSSVSVTNVTIAGIFNHFDHHGNVNHLQMQHLASFLKAVDDMNSMYHPRFHLNYVIRSAYGHADASIVADSLRNTIPDLIGVVNGLDITEVTAMASMLGDQSQGRPILHAHTVTSDSIMSHADLYPYKFNLSPVDSLVGKVSYLVIYVNRN